MVSSGNLTDRPRASLCISSAMTPAGCPVSLAKHHRGPEMNCQRCGSQMPDAAAFCHNCGAPKAAANPAQATPPSSPPQGQYPPNPYLQAQYPPQGNPQGYAAPPPQPSFQQNPYPPQYQQSPYPAKPAQQQSTAMRIIIIIVSILSILVGLLRIFRVFR